VNPSIEDWGVRRAPFVVLVATEMPAILAEVSCMSSEEEASRLSHPEYRQAIAEALNRGIRAYAESHNISKEKGT
jgi:N-acetylmuramoyl-L-alanine amidase